MQSKALHTVFFLYIFIHFIDFSLRKSIKRAKIRAQRTPEDIPKLQP